MRSKVAEKKKSSFLSLCFSTTGSKENFEISKNYGLVDFVMAKIDISELSQAELSDLLVEVMFRLRQFEGEEGENIKIDPKVVTKTQKLRLGESVRELLRQNCK